MKKETNLDSTKTMSGRQKFLVVGIIALLAIGALGAMGEFSGKKNGIISHLAETVGLKQKEVNSSETYQPQTGTPQLSKEYVYAGSRMLATEDYGIVAPNPTPTPLVEGGGSGGNGTPTPTPTATPTPDPTTGCQYGFSSLGGVINSDPTTSVFVSNIYVFALGTDGVIYYQYSSGGAFSGWVALGGIITSNPASMVNGSGLFVEGTGTDGNRYYQINSNGSNFSGWIGGSVTTTTNPSAVLNGQTYTFVKGTGSLPHLCVKVQ